MSLVHERKPMGMTNHGLTCFANAVLQCLLHAPGLQLYLESQRNNMQIMFNELPAYVGTVGGEERLSVSEQLADGLKNFQDRCRANKIAHAGGAQFETDLANFCLRTTSANNTAFDNDLDTILLAALAELRAGRTVSCLGGRFVELVYGGRAEDFGEGDTDELFMACLEKNQAQFGGTAVLFGAPFFSKQTCAACQWVVTGSFLQYQSFRVQCEWDKDTEAHSVQSLLYANVGRHPMATPVPAHACNNQACMHAQYFSGVMPVYLAIFLQRFKYHEATPNGGYEGYIDDRRFTMSETLELWERNTDPLGSPLMVAYKLYAAIFFKGRDQSGHYIAYVRRENDWFRTVCIPVPFYKSHAACTFDRL